MDKKKAVKEIKKEVASKPVKNDKFSVKIPDLKKLFFKPTEFLNSVEKERDYQPILTSYLLFYICYFILSVLLGLTISAFDLKTTLLGFVGVVFYSILAPFFIAGIIHIFVLIFGGKEGFFNTFKPVTYSLVIMLIYSFIILILTTAIHFAMPYDLGAMQNIQSISDPNAQYLAYQEFIKQPGAITTIIVSAVFVLISIIHMFIFLIKGLNKFQRISRLKASAVIILGLIVGIVLLVILSLFNIPTS